MTDRPPCADAVRHATPLRTLIVGGLGTSSRGRRRSSYGMTASASTSTKGGVDESTDLHDRRSRTDVGEELAMRPPDFLPAVDIGHEHPGAHNVLKVRTNLFKGFRDSADSFAGLLSYILATDSPAIRLSGGRAGYRHPLASPHASSPRRAPKVPPMTPAPCRSPR